MPGTILLGTGDTAVGKKTPAGQNFCPHGVYNAYNIKYFR